jgi:hypothetical protein
VERFTKGVDFAVTVPQATAALELKEADPRPLKIGGVSLATSSASGST